MRIPLRLLLLAVHITAHAANPYICFTDLLSWPATGNSDNSRPGQIAGADGAIVTLRDKNPGAAQGSSQILVGGYNHKD
jgi:hypothetical protein